jgi:prepilin-type N-terminal cleavage/methylation domain-containing protein
MNIYYPRRTARPSAAFTLVEIMIVVVIIGILLTLGFNSYSDSLRRGRITSVVGAVASCKTATFAYLTKPGSPGVIPLTDGNIPTTQFSGTGTTSANVALAASLDQVFLAEGLFASPLAIKMGPQNNAVSGVGVNWSPATGTFTAGAAPTADRTSIPRVECQLSTTRTPSTAAGTNFFLDGTNNLPTNVRVAALVIPNVPAEDALQLSLMLDGPAMTPLSNDLDDDRGIISYAAPVNGLTTVYAYVVHY